MTLSQATPGAIVAISKWLYRVYQVKGKHAFVREILDNGSEGECQAMLPGTACRLGTSDTAEAVDGSDDTFDPLMADTVRNSLPLWEE